ncbi:MAG: ABC transporter substrate-binding protein, partial [Rubrobacter sp.]|nr:ABC transporter substrate-binding protein [Rubrobacter sp.]
GPGSFIHDAIRLAGGENVAAETGESYPSYSEEQLIEEDPEHYLYGSLSGSSASDIGDREAYSSLEAVEEGNVTEINDDLISRPGPRIVDGVRQIAEALHPEQFEGE